MTNSPFFRAPFYPPHYPNYYSSNPSRNSTFPSTSSTPKKEETPFSSPKNTSPKEKSSKYYAFGPIRFKNPIGDDKEEPIFEILGIQLYLDDLIILSLLFFLYKEEVKDELLFICLILLLLS